MALAGLGKAGAAAESDAVAPALHKIERAAIAASTHITYPPSELLMLVEDHLRASGLHASADMLTREAGLTRLPADGLNRLSADAAATDPQQITEPQETPFLAVSAPREPATPATQPSKGANCKIPGLCFWIADHSSLSWCPIVNHMSMLSLADCE